MSLWFDGLRASEDTTESSAVGGVLHIHVAVLLLRLCLLCVRKQRAGLPLPSEMCGQKTTNTQKYLTAALHHRTHTHTDTQARVHTHKGDFPTTNHSHSNGRRRTNTEENYRDRNIWPVATTDNNLLTAGTWQQHKLSVHLFTFSNVFSAPCCFLSTPMNLRSVRRTTSWYSQRFYVLRKLSNLGVSQQFLELAYINPSLRVS